MTERGFIAVLRRNKNAYPPKSTILHLAIKIRTLSRYTSKEIIKPFPSARELH